MAKAIQTKKDLDAEIKEGKHNLDKEQNKDNEYK